MLGCQPHAMTDQDLYERSQMHAAILSVVLHDIRNRLHSSTLLVEALASETADVEALRGKLRTQLTRLNAVISDAAELGKDLLVEPRIQKVGLGRILDAVRERMRVHTESSEFMIAAEGTEQLEVAADPVLVACAMIELGQRLREAAGKDDSLLRGREEVRVLCIVGSTDEAGVRLTIDYRDANHSDSTANLPEIAAHDVRLAVARSLADSGGCSLRLERSAGGRTAFVLRLRRA
jgi:hypothetical protein